MELETLIRICKAYRQLGWAIQEQLDHVIADDMTGDNMNPHALGEITDWLDEVYNNLGDGDLLHDVDQLHDRIREFDFSDEEECDGN